MACFYIQPRIAGKQLEDSYHRAVYLARRSLHDLVSAIARKCDVDCAEIGDVIRLNAKGLRIKFDDDMVCELTEGQDMVAQLDHIKPTSHQELCKTEEGPTYTLTLQF